eukprot:1447394-Amphidinium_carterae.2
MLTEGTGSAPLCHLFKARSVHSGCSDLAAQRRILAKHDFHVVPLSTIARTLLLDVHPCMPWYTPSLT